MTAKPNKRALEEVQELSQVAEPEVIEKMRLKVIEGIIASKRPGFADRDAIARDVNRMAPRIVMDLYGHYVESVQTHVM